MKTDITVENVTDVQQLILHQLQQLSEAQAHGQDKSEQLIEYVMDRTNEMIGHILTLNTQVNNLFVEMQVIKKYINRSSNSDTERSWFLDRWSQSPEAEKLRRKSQSKISGYQQGISVMPGSNLYSENTPPMLQSRSRLNSLTGLLDVSTPFLGSMRFSPSSSGTTTPYSVSTSPNITSCQTQLLRSIKKGQLPGIQQVRLSSQEADLRQLLTNYGLADNAEAMSVISTAIQKSNIPSSRAIGLHTVFVLDTSSSMAQYAQQLKTLVTKSVDCIDKSAVDLGLEEHVAIVTCGEYPGIAQHFTNDYGQIRKCLDSLRWQGGTHFLTSLILTLCYLELQGESILVHNELIAPRIVVISDFKPTADVNFSGPDQDTDTSIMLSRNLLSLCQTFKSRGYSVTCVPVTDNSTLGLCSQLASECQGEVVPSNQWSLVGNYYRYQLVYAEVMHQYQQNMAIDPDIPKLVDETMPLLNLTPDCKDTVLAVIVRRMMNPSNEGTIQQDVPLTEGQSSYVDPGQGSQTGYPEQVYSIATVKQPDPPCHSLRAYQQPQWFKEAPQQKYFRKDNVAVLPLEHLTQHQDFYQDQLMCNQQQQQQQQNTMHLSSTLQQPQQQQQNTAGSEFPWQQQQQVLSPRDKPSSRSQWEGKDSQFEAQELPEWQCTATGMDEVPLEEIGRLPSIGSRVQRVIKGQEDEGGPGTVVGHKEEGVLFVLWDTNRLGTYRYNYPRAVDVQVTDKPRQVPPMHIDVGCSVVRGEDWEREDEDGGQGTVGVVIRKLANRYVLVRWPSRVMERYKFGAENTWELSVVVEKKEVEPVQGASPSLPVPDTEPMEVVWMWQDQSRQWHLFADESSRQMEALYLRDSSKPVMIHYNNTTIKVNFTQSQCTMDNRTVEIHRERMTLQEKLERLELEKFMQ